MAEGLEAINFHQWDYKAHFTHKLGLNGRLVWFRIVWDQIMWLNIVSHTKGHFTLWLKVKRPSIFTNSWDYKAHFTHMLGLDGRLVWFRIVWDKVMWLMIMLPNFDCVSKTIPSRLLLKICTFLIWESQVNFGYTYNQDF